MKINSIANNLNFDRFEVDKDKLPRELVLEAQILEDYFQTGDDFWLKGLNYKSNKKTQLIEEFKNRWKDTFPYRFINDLLILFEDSIKQKPTKISNHIISETPTVETTETHYKIPQINKQFLIEDTILITLQNPIRIICKDKNYEINWTIN